MAEEAGESIVAEAEEPKKKGLPLVPIFVAIVLIGAIGGVGWFVVLPMLSGETAEGEEEVPGEVVEEQDASLGPEVYDPENRPGILEFPEPFLIKLKKVEGVLQSEMYLKLSISLEVTSPEIEEEMMGDTVVMARISDSIITFFAEKTSNSVDSVRWPDIKDRLMERINNHFGEDYKIQRINFHSFLIQPGR